MKEFFKVTRIDQVLNYSSRFPYVGTEEIPIVDSFYKNLAMDIQSEIDLPDFVRSTMDGYAVLSSSTFGASEGNPAYLDLKGTISMGEVPTFSIGPGEAAKISTGGMLPKGSDSVIMIEHTEEIDDSTIEIYRSVAPGHHVIDIGEDVGKGENLLCSGHKIRAQEMGLMAAFGVKTVLVFKKPIIGIISTGDELVSIDKTPRLGQIRDINTYTLSSLVKQAGAEPKNYGIVKDRYDSLLDICSTAIQECDMVLISGGSSVGTRDLTVEVLTAIPESSILVHGISISPGKPTILARVGDKAVWGLPGHVVSAMIVFKTIVEIFIEKIAGLSIREKKPKYEAKLTRNIPSAQGRVEFIRVKLLEKNGRLWADPVIGKSGLISTMIKADGLIEIGINTEGLDKEAMVSVIPF